MRRWGVLLAAAAAVLSCTGPASRKVEPIATPEASDTCPGGRQSWALDVVDHRAERDRVDTERMRTILTDSIKGSFPGCRWEGAASGEPVIRIEVWQFRSTFLDGLWEARASWTVEVGHDSRFEVEEGVSRPRYQGSDNEAQSLRDVFAAAMQKTNDGLRAVPSR